MTEYDPENVFAKILENKIPYQKVYEDNHVLAFKDIAPAAPIHILVITKSKCVSFDDLDPQEYFNFFSAVRKITRMLQLTEKGFRLVTNHGKDGGQIIPHFHLHILGGSQMGSMC